MEQVMQMYFYQTPVVTFLIQNWTTTSTGAYCAALVAVMLLGIFCQFLARVGRYYDAELLNLKCNCASSLDEVGMSKTFLFSKNEKTTYYTTSEQSIRTVIFFLHSGLIYLLMLLSMTYNVGVFVSILVGLSIGFFLFAYDAPSTHIKPCC